MYNKEAVIKINASLPELLIVQLCLVRPVNMSFRVVIFLCALLIETTQFLEAWY